MSLSSRRVGRYVVAMDFDGTLYNHTRKGICPLAIKELHRIGGGKDVSCSASEMNTVQSPGTPTTTAAGAVAAVRVVNTGRNWFSLQKDLPLDCPIDYAISGSGAYAAKWPCGTRVFAHTLCPTAVDTLTRLLLEELQLPFFLLAEPPYSHHCYASYGPPGSSISTVNSNFAKRCEIYQNVTCEITTTAATSQLMPSLASMLLPVNEQNPASNTNNTAAEATVPVLTSRRSEPLPSATPQYAAFLLMLRDAAEFESTKAAIQTAAAKLGQMGADGSGGGRRGGGVKVIRTTSPLDSSMVWLEVVPDHVGKGASLAHLLDVTSENSSIGGGDATNHHILSVGNDFNDLELLHWGDTAALVGDSSADLLARIQTQKKEKEEGEEERHEKKTTTTHEKEETAITEGTRTETEASVDLLCAQRKILIGDAIVTHSSSSSDDEDNFILGSEKKKLLILSGTSSKGGIAEAIQYCFKF